MNNHRSRKTWDQTRTETKSAFLIHQPVAKEREYSLIREDIPPAYEDYLTELGRKNREKRDLTQARDPRDMREEGFSLYFNGTHAKGRYRSKTGGQGEGATSKQTKVRIGSKESLVPQSAPSKRKGWKAVSSVTLKTEEGNHLKVEFSPKISGIYEDDFEAPLVTKHPPINVSSGGSESEISDHCEEDLNTSISRPINQRAPLEMCGEPPVTNRGPSRTTSTCSVTSVRRHNLNESLADLQQAISAINKENMPLDTYEFSTNESPLPPEDPLRDSLETTFDTECATSATSTSGDYWRKHSMFGEVDTLKGVAVQLEVSSTWGHPNQMGLTEVEFYTTQNKKVWLSGTRVKAEGHINTYNLGHILNGKTHTTHDTHMWSALYRGRKKVRFHFLVPIGTKYELGAIRIWNYNKPSCLNAGVRGVKIVVDNVSVWEGEIPKATGTKNYDYAHVVRIHIPDSYPSNGSFSDTTPSPEKCKPDQLIGQRESYKPDQLIGQRESYKPDQLIGQRESYKPDQLIGQRESYKPDQLIRRVRYNPFKSPIFVTTSEPNTPLQSDTATQYKPHTSPQLTNYTSQQLTNQLSRRRTAIQAPKLKYSASQSNILECLFSPTNQILEKSYSESELSKFLSADSLTFQAPKHGRRSQMRLGTAVTGKARPELPDAELTDVTHLYGSKTRHNSTTSRHISSPSFSHSKAYPSNTPSLKSSHTEPVISGAKPVPSFEDMLQSLATFQRSHRGRIVDLEEDTLDQFLEDRSRTRDTPIKLEPIPEPEFLIPELPHGKFLSLIITSTWGDRHYLGLNGIEAFSSNGSKIEVCDIAADPPDINILTGYGSDPRVAGNLIDGVNRTRDDLHMWLTPFTPGESHLVHLEFSSASHLAMLRIWNYNKSRIHSHRGARHIRIELDGTPVFVGEIARASGGVLSGTESFGDTILFTENENILSLISENDETYLGDMSDEMECDLLESGIDDSFVSRPDTSDKERPFTAAGATYETTKPTQGDEFVAQKVSLCLLTNWEISGEMGLTGVSLLAPDTSTIDLSAEQLVMYKVSQDGTRVPLDLDTSHLLSDNLTQERDNMLLWELEDGCQTLLEIVLPCPVPLGGVVIWNYNLTPEDTYSGVMQLDILLDDTFVSEYPFILRKAPGHLRYQFGQEIIFSEDTPPPDSCDTIDIHSLMPLFTPEVAPTGFVVELQILSTWGDTYYVGLSGVELFDTSGHKIHLEAKNVAAFPESINVLESVDGDLRTPDKLVDGTHSFQDGAHSWLTPLLPNTTTSVYFIFDNPISFSAIRIWNYNKNYERGVKEFSVLIDDLIIYNGSMPPAKQDATQNDTITPYLALLLDQSHFENSRDTSRATSEVMLCGDQLCRPFTSLTGDTS